MEIAQKYPDYGLGYYSAKLNRNLAVGPVFDPKFLRPVNRPKAYITGKYEFELVEKSVLWDEKPIITVRYPLYRNGIIIGHTFANSKVEDVEAAYEADLIKRCINIIGIWLVVMLTTFYMGHRFKESLGEFANNIKNDSKDNSNFKDFPELAPILEMIIDLRAEVRKKGDELERTLENISDIFYSLDKNMVFTYANNSAKRLLGQELIGKYAPSLLSNNPSFFKKIEDAIKEKKTICFEEIGPLNEKHIEVNIYPAKDGGGSVLFKDITERKKFENQVQKANERFLKAFHMNPTLMMLISLKDFTYIDVNNAYLTACGKEREEIIGLSTDQFNLIAQPKDKEEITRLILEHGSIVNYEFEYYAKGVIRVGLLAAEIIELNDESCILNVVTDITDKRLLEDEISKYERLNFIGEVAASLGHEIRNPMTTVRGYLQMFQLKPQFSTYKDEFGTMIEELDRANQIITEFLSLAKNKNQQLKPCNLTSIIYTIFPLIQADAFRLGHKVISELEEIPTLLLDDGEIRQLILNLSRNAVEAMEKSGTLTIRTYTDNNCIVLEVADTGKGIPLEIIDKIGTPFLTTKENGTGLGLAVVYRVAQRNNATVDVNTSDEGTTFIVRFALNKLTEAEI